MRLYLIQHGQSLSEEEDPKRPLSGVGRLETEAMMKFLKSEGISLDAIWHSSKLRAIQTAKILASGFDVAVVERQDLAPNDPVAPIAAELENREKDIMIVGHLPFLQKLASLLLTGDELRQIISFKYSGVLCLENTPNWKVLFFVTPDELK